MDNITFDEVELNHLLVLVQNRIAFTNSSWGIPFAQRKEMNEPLKDLEAKILKMIEG